LIKSRKRGKFKKRIKLENNQSLDHNKIMNGQNKKDLKIGSEVEIVLKEDQRTGKLTRGIVAEILTSSAFHHRGIKVRLKDGKVGRVQKIYPAFPEINGQEYQEGLI
jgi:uncharacterized repeat protein (TIGR03833 family)